ncbi:MAG TPA: hypothetical protein VFL95_02280 [Gemmatimonadales bacterium]|nr:hypothetical protein [Gemmatimonadales bacterium]
MTAAANAAPERLIDRLASFRPGSGRVVTCYLKLEPRDRARGKYLIKMKNRLRAAQEELPQLKLERSVQEAVSRDLGRIAEYLQHPDNLPSSQGVAIFAAEPANLFEVVPLASVHRSRLAVDRVPLVRELAAIEDEFGRLLVVVFDRTNARFFAVTADGAEELPGIPPDTERGNRSKRDRSGPGLGEHTYHNRIRQERQRHYEQIARRLFTLDREDPVRGFVLAATGRDAAALLPFLHRYVADRVMGTTRLNLKQLTPALVHQSAVAVRQEWARERERAAVAEARERLGTGWAVSGLRPTLRALARGQARVLLLQGDTQVPGYRCSDSGALVLTPGGCGRGGDPEPVLDVVDEAIEDALRQGVDVVVVTDEEAGAAIDGAAALLRFR